MRVELAGLGVVFGMLALVAVPARAAGDQAVQVEFRPRIYIQDTVHHTPTGYTPAQIRHAYGFDLLANQGAGQKIALVEAFGSPTVQNDLNAFCTAFSIPSATVHIYYPLGTPAVVDPGWALETSLDVEWAHAIAPQATLLLVVAPGAGLVELLSAVDYAVSLGADQVAMSWGTAEFPTETSYDSRFNHVGVTFTAPAGDNGSGVIWPAASPFVIAVGGTTLRLDASGDVLSETAWSFSGGGKSGYETEPAYQAEWVETYRRLVPDVSYNADPNTGFAVYDSTPYAGLTGWFQLGGTSACTPQWAGLIALANAQRTHSLSAALTPLYLLGSPLMETRYYRDVTSGSDGGFSAGPGYDEITGLGTPLANKIVPALVTY